MKLRKVFVSFVVVMVVSCLVSLFVPAASADWLTIYQQVDNSSDLRVGGADTTYVLGYSPSNTSLSNSGYLKVITINLKKTASANSGTITMKVYQLDVGDVYPNNGQAPYEVSTSSYDANSLTTSYAGYSFTFNGSTLISKSVAYEWFFAVAVDISASSIVDIDTKAVAGGGLSSDDGATWAANSNSLTCYVVGDEAAPAVPADNLYVALDGGIFHDAFIASAPTEITLQKGKLYTLDCSVYYDNATLEGNGTYYEDMTTMTTSWETMVARSESDYIPLNGTIVNGTFTISMPTGVSGSVPVYWNMRIRCVLDSGGAVNRTFYFGWYGIGESGHSGTPYPTDGGGADDPTGGDDTGGTSTDNQWVSINNFWSFIILLIICGMPAMVLGAVGAKDGWGLQGFIFGTIIGMGAGVAAGMLPVWLVALMGMMIVVAAFTMIHRS